MTIAEKNLEIVFTARQAWQKFIKEWEMEENAKLLAEIEDTITELNCLDQGAYLTIQYEDDYKSVSYEIAGNLYSHYDIEISTGKEHYFESTNSY